MHQVIADPDNRASVSAHIVIHTRRTFSIRVILFFQILFVSLNSAYVRLNPAIFFITSFY